MPTFAEQQVTRIEALLAENPGVQGFTIGNTSVSYDDMLKQYDYWRNKVAREQGTRPFLSRINLSGF